MFFDMNNERKEELMEGFKILKAQTEKELDFLKFLGLSDVDYQVELDNRLDRLILIKKSLKALENE
jgi:hypothetical protein